MPVQKINHIFVKPELIQASHLTVSSDVVHPGHDDGVAAHEAVALAVRSHDYLVNEVVRLQARCDSIATLTADLVQLRKAAGELNASAASANDVFMCLIDGHEDDDERTEAFELARDMTAKIARVEELLP